MLESFVRQNNLEALSHVYMESVCVTVDNCITWVAENERTCVTGDC